MSRSTWAAALGVSVFALAATSSASPGEPVQPASIHAEQASYPVPIVHHIVPVQTPALRHPARHTNAIRHRGHSAARALTHQPHIVLLAPGSGFQQAAGSEPVRVLQRRLTGLGFSPGPIDGRYGPLTTQAVERFQSAYGLSPDGIVGPRSVAALNAKTDTTSVALRPGGGYRMNADVGRVRVLQRRLARLGFAPGPIDGRYGPLTTQAVERFQSARRLTVNGVAGADTLRVLFTVPRRSPVTVSSQPRSSSQPHSAVPARSTPPVSSQPHSAVPARSTAPVSSRPHSAVPARSTAPVSSQPHSAVPARSTSPVEAAPVSGEHSPALPVAPVLLALAALGIAVMLLRSGRYTRRRHSDRFVPSPETRNNRDEPARLERQASLGVPLETQTDMAATLAAYRRADQSGDPTGAFNLGVLLEERGELAEALAAYRRADQRGHGAAASNLGVLLEERGELAEALAAYRRADQSGDPTGAFNLGVLLEERGELAEAEAAYRRADQPGDGELAKMARAALFDLGGRIQDSKAAQTVGQVSA
jgi:peptidoglycan hydrolase-like protein with peptidoglycan-binding domain/Flp pilus assembly protein TadD